MELMLKVAKLHHFLNSLNFEFLDLNAIIYSK